ncbi:MAG: ABC transporter permease subunit [Propionibacteriaceae bacterium]|jgi:ABC-type transport system involved in multi-copper enzyme maturation permease subunit|nr:ABC transporter permease subunit [Propionibacteriaceae bacterium]
MKTWSLSWGGLTTVAALELRQRVRSSRWLAALIVWFLVIGGITLLVINAAQTWKITPSQPYCAAGACHLPDNVSTVCQISAAGPAVCAPADAAGSTAGEETTCSVQPDGSVLCSILSDFRPPLSCSVAADGTAACSYDEVDGWRPTIGPLVFSLVVLFVLGLGLLVTPALTATSINGDRHAGTLATLQATRLSAAEIALGKLLAAWATLFAFLAAALPWLATGVVIGGLPILGVLVCVGVLLLELAVVCALGLGWSALINRTSGSSLLTYASVVTLSFLTLIALVLALPLVSTPTQVQVWRLPKDVQAQWEQEMSNWWEANDEALANGETTVSPQPVAPVSQCHWETVTETLTHTERIWQLTVLNPFAIVADAAPEPPVARSHPNLYAGYSGDILFSVRHGIAELAAGPNLESDLCPYSDGAIGPTGLPEASPIVVSPSEPAVIWPWGLAVSLAIGGLFFWIAVRRLRIPYGALPKGTRVA